MTPSAELTRQELVPSLASSVRSAALKIVDQQGLSSCASFGDKAPMQRAWLTLMHENREISKDAYCLKVVDRRVKAEAVRPVRAAEDMGSAFVVEATPIRISAMAANGA